MVGLQVEYFILNYYIYTKVKKKQRHTTNEKPNMYLGLLHFSVISHTRLLGSYFVLFLELSTIQQH